MNRVSKYKILGIISILLFIIEWILYSNLGIIIALIFEIIALINKSLQIQQNSMT